MAEATLIVKEAVSEPTIVKIEELLLQVNGIERVLVDTNDGEIKVEFNADILTEELIAHHLTDNHFTIG